MNVVVTAPTWSLNGVNVFSANLVRGLQQRGFAARLLLTNPHRTDAKPLPVPSDLPLEKLAVKAHSAWPARWQALSQYLETLAPCIYMPNYDYGYSCISSILSAGVGIVGIAHSDDVQHYNHVSRLGRYWNAVVAVSTAITEQIRQRQPELSGRLMTIPYGVQYPAQWPERPDVATLRLLYTGRLEQSQKRVLDLVPLATRLRQRGLRFELNIYGNGPAHKALEQQILNEGLTDLVKLWGTLAPEQMQGVYAQHDLFLLTSAFEGLPLSLLEAMSQGCVPVVSDVKSGIPEVIEDGLNGYRIAVGALDTFADRILTLARQPALRQRLSRNAWETIEQKGYQWSDMVGHYINLFERLAEENRSGAFIRPYAPIAPPPKPTLKTRLLALARPWLSAQGY